MHHALRLEEILHNIFGHCYSSSSTDKQRTSHATVDLAALARTCRTFKEPALDVLWTELTNLSPLARCLPQASHRIYPGYTKWYSFSRPLKPAEWDTLRGYARRVRSVQDFTRGLNWDSVMMLFDPTAPDPMFPNLRHLRWEFIRESFRLMHHLAVSSLTSLDINFVFGDVPPFHSFPQSLADLCPNIRRFRMHMRRPQVSWDETVSGLVCRWTNLQELCCPYIGLDVDSLLHLSRTPSLTHLSFTLNAKIADDIIASHSMLLFSKLQDLEICSQSLEFISRLLPYVRVPSLESLTVCVDSCPSKYAFKSYLTGLLKICTPHSLSSLKLVQTRSLGSSSHGAEQHQLTLDDIRPCMSFSHLRCIDINTVWTVRLTDDDLLELASACPRLERLLINEEWGWGTEGGVTPTGLAQLLFRLEALHHVCLAIDTRGNVPSVLPLGRMGRLFCMNVVDSAIRPESVDALAGFFGRLMQMYVSVMSCYWGTTTMGGRLDAESSKRLWEDVFVKAHAQVGSTLFPPVL